MTHTSGHTHTGIRQVDAAARPERLHPAATSLLLQPDRREVRFGVRGLLTHSPVFGQAVEVSASGLRLESYSALVVGGRYVFRLNYGARFLNLPGKVAWSRLARFEPTSQGRRAVHEAGIELDAGQDERRWRSALANRACVALGA